MRAEVQVIGDASLVDLGIRRLRLIEATVGRLLPMSELNRFNRSAGQWVALSDDLLHALREAVDLYGLTEGLFDPRIVPAPAEQSEPFGLSVDTEHRARIGGDSRLDLAAIAPGIAADAVVDALLGAGAEAVQVTVGRTTRVGGAHPDGGFHLRLPHPVSGRPFIDVLLTDGGLTNAVGPGGGCGVPNREARQVIDPRTGGPLVTDILGAVVTAGRAALADALARAALVAGSTAAPRVLAHACQWWLVTDGGVLRS